MIRRIIIICASLALYAVTSTAQVLNGNEASNGQHFNLNIIGVSKDKTADMTGSQGHTILVRLGGKSKILLTEVELEVLDRNGTEGEGALFSLPRPDPDNDGVTVYSVSARALSKPEGEATITACGTDPATGE